LLWALAEYAAMLSDEPFGDKFARRAARALRAGVIVRHQPEDRIEVCGRSLYEGVGLSFGSAGKLGCPPFVNTCTSKDEVCFSVDSCWIGWDDQEPSQHCASVVLSRPCLHMGPHGLSPNELAIDMCQSLPSVLTWLDEEKFINFLATNSERSLALLLGSGPQGSITMQKLEGAVLRHEHYVRTPGLSGTFWYGDRAFAAENEAADVGTRQPGKLIPVSTSSDALRSLANSKDALTALERVVQDLEQQWYEGKLDEDSVRYWLNQLVAQAGTIDTGVTSIETTTLGIVGEPVRGLKSDMKRGVEQLLKHVDLLSGKFGLGPIQ